jgi:hypothetical protein
MIASTIIGCISVRHALLKEKNGKNGKKKAQNTKRVSITFYEN